MPKYITNYTDEHANTCYGMVVLLGEEKDGSIKITHPIDFKDRWSSINLSCVTLLPTSMNVAVGFYSIKTHYNILKQLGKTTILSSTTSKYMNELSSTSSINNYTWYSNGYKVKDTMKHSQQTLF